VSDAASPKPKAQLDADFSELYRAHLRDVYSYAYYRVGNHHDAEDLTEQTFLQAYRHFERAQRESDGRPLRPWLIRIAHNLAANLYRDRSRKPASPIEDTTALAAPHTTEQLVEGREQARHVLDGVSRLPEDRREALIMRFALGMDNREIARALGRSDGATKVLIHRAIKQLEGLLDEEDVRDGQSVVAGRRHVAGSGDGVVEGAQDAARRGRSGSSDGGDAADE
jgi:RNA polymerase sigma-70 factor, ECF subfamily